MDVARMLPARCRQPQAGSPVLPESTCRANERTVSAQKFRGAHSAFSFQLHVPQRKRALAGGNDQLPLAAQNFPRLAAKIDNRCGKYFQVLSADLRKRAWPRIKRANFSLDCFCQF